MISQAGKQTIVTHMLPNISQSKDNQAMKLGQVKEYKKRNIFSKNHGENGAGRLVPNLFLIF